MKLIIAGLALALTLAGACNSDHPCQTEEECEAEFGPDCDAIYDKCVGKCASASCHEACEAAKAECENQ
ncbi:MAG TPA: hypothetical protein VK714_20365 [Myxococcota bacterium]|nr:hypothetical protein [Myxococcota bacterium]